MLRRELCFIIHFAGTAVFLAAAVSSAQENYVQWAFNKNITINTSTSGYDIAGNVNNFPYLVRLSTKDSLIFKQAQGKGQDIRFARNGGHLSYEIEQWDSTAKKAAVWVKIDTIFGNNSTQVITLYWSKSGVATASNGSQVFETTNSFAGVWHLNETGNTDAGGYKDATGNANHGTGMGMAPGATIAGIAGPGQQFDGAVNLVRVNDAPSLRCANNLTISGWGNSNLSGIQRLLFKNDGFGFGVNGSNLRFTTRRVHDYDGSMAMLSADSWYHLAAVMKPDNSVTFYVDGIESETLTGSAPATLGTGSLNIGALDNSLEFWAGKLDEVRLDNTARSADWIKLCYGNQRYVVDNAPIIKYPQKDIVLNVMTVVSVTPFLSGDAPDSIIITPFLPSFLSFDKKTGSISSFLGEAAAKATYYVRAVNAAGFSEDTISITGVDSSAISGIISMTGENESKIQLLGVNNSATPEVLYRVLSAKPVRSMQFSMADCKGRTIWSSTISGAGLRSGVRALTINDGLPSGMYFLEMKTMFFANQTPLVQKKTVLMYR